MRFPIRPDKAACAGLVAILMVLPNSIWRGPDSSAGTPSRLERIAGSPRRSAQLRKMPRRAVRAEGVAQLTVRGLD